MRDRELIAVSELDEAAMLVVFASRIHRSGQQCLCSLFHAAGMCGAQAVFVELLDVLSADSGSGFVAGERGARTVNQHEALLLGALSHWQRHPGDLSGHAFELWISPTVCRVAAPLAREFARLLRRAGFQLRMELPEIDFEPRWLPAPLSLVH